MSELKVLIGDQFAFASDTIGVSIILQHSQEERSVLHFDTEGYAHWEAINEMAMTKPTLTLPNDVARALLDALTRHYQGASDMHTVRKDLIFERNRVDTLIAALLNGKERDDKLFAALIDTQGQALSLALGE